MKLIRNFKCSWYAVCDVSDLTSSMCVNAVCSEINSTDFYKTLNLKTFKNIMNILTYLVYGAESFLRS